MPVTDEPRLRFGIVTIFRSRHFEIEYTYSEPLLILVSATIARSDHDPPARFLFPAEINHGVRDRGIALNRVSASPEQ